MAYFFSVSESVSEYCRGFRDFEEGINEHVRGNKYRKFFREISNYVLGLIWWPLIAFNG